MWPEMTKFRLEKKTGSHQVKCREMPTFVTTQDAMPVRATGNVVSTVVTPLHEHCTPNLAWAWPESKRREGATPDSPRMVARIVD